VSFIFERDPQADVENEIRSVGSQLDEWQPIINAEAGLQSQANSIAGWCDLGSASRCSSPRSSRSAPNTILHSPTALLRWTLPVPAPGSSFDCRFVSPGAKASCTPPRSCVADGGAGEVVSDEDSAEQLECFVEGSAIGAGDKTVDPDRLAVRLLPEFQKGSGCEDAPIMAVRLEEPQEDQVAADVVHARRETAANPPAHFQARGFFFACSLAPSVAPNVEGS
jgi:hypothetical protein